QATSPWRVRLRDLFLHGIDGTRVQDFVANNLKPLPTYGEGAFAARPARLAPRRTVGTLFPQTDRLDDRLGPTWAAVALDTASGTALRDAGLAVVDPGADGAWLRDHKATWAILRPDRFVFACGGPADVAAALEAWRPVALSAASPSPATKEAH
ncbi:MAG: hypothetical protein JOZ56_11360, partial [Actinobacteria bacterium]|nr:hypothetical protein [Actinomycetota bacterium]